MMYFIEQKTPWTLLSHHSTWKKKIKTHVGWNLSARLDFRRHFYSCPYKITNFIRCVRESCLKFFSGSHHSKGLLSSSCHPFSPGDDLPVKLSNLSSGFSIFRLRIFYYVNLFRFRREGLMEKVCVTYFVSFYVCLSVFHPFTSSLIHFLFIFILILPFVPFFLAFWCFAASLFISFDRSPLCCSFGSIQPSALPFDLIPTHNFFLCRLILLTTKILPFVEFSLSPSLPNLCRFIILVLWFLLHILHIFTTHYAFNP